MAHYPFIIPTTSSDSDTDDVKFFVGLQRLIDHHELVSTGRRIPIDRNRILANQVLLDDYFVERPKYNEVTFRNRFRMPKTLFLSIMNDLEVHFEYFQNTQDASGAPSFTPIQKCTTAIRQLGTGNPPDNFDECLQMSARTSRECLQFFCNSIVKLYSDEFMRSPTSHDIVLLYEAHRERHGLPGMIGSIDCTHWTWRGCPRDLCGQYHRGDHEYPTVILEAIASQDLWFWHGFFGSPGSNNDLNVLNHSPLFVAETHGQALAIPFHVNGRNYKGEYLLGHGIYPDWSVIMNTYLPPVTIPERKWKMVQESARKDVERVFGVLKARWGIVNSPARQTTKNRTINIMYACMILHNMILKHDGRAISPNWIQDPPTNVPDVYDEEVVREISDHQAHFRLKFNLRTHVDQELDIELNN